MPNLSQYNVCAVFGAMILPIASCMLIYFLET